MPRKFCRDRILEVLESVSEPISTSQIAKALPGDSRDNVNQALRKMHRRHLVLRKQKRGRGSPCYWWVEPPLVIPVHEDDTAADRMFCAELDRAIASARKGWEKRL